MDKADQFLASHDIPLAYSYNPSYRSDSYLSYWLISADGLPFILQQAGAELRIYPVFLDGKEHPNVRVAEVPERPPGKIISVIVRDNPDNGWKKLESHRADDGTQP